jgi:hypothetical protein
LTPEIADYDLLTLTALAANLTIANPATSVPTDGEMLRIRVLDNGTARTFTFGTAYVARAGIPFPTTTVISKLTELCFEYNAAITKWNLIAFAQEV